MKRLIAKIKKFFKKIFSKKEKIESSENVVANNTSTSTQQPTPSSQSSTTQQTIFKYESFGSPNCSKCVEDPKVQIKNLKWSKNQLSYQWASSTKLEQWGINDPHDAKALAVFGYLDKNEVWKFAKIDWISSDRLTRDMHNVNCRYNGINPDEYFAAKQHGFFIMESNGKRRSNILIV